MGCWGHGWIEGAGGREDGRQTTWPAMPIAGESSQPTWLSRQSWRRDASPGRDMPIGFDQDGDEFLRSGASILHPCRSDCNNDGRTLNGPWLGVWFRGFDLGIADQERVQG